MHLKKSIFYELSIDGQISVKHCTAEDTELTTAFLNGDIIKMWVEEIRAYIPVTITGKLSYYGADGDLIVIYSFNWVVENEKKP